MNSDKFKAQYQVADGYAGGARPQTFNILAADLEDDMDELALEQFYENSIQDHFEQNICPNSEKKEQFIAWAKEQLAKRSA